MMEGVGGHNYQLKMLKRVELDIIKRLVTLLHYEGKMKKTNIAMKCNMSYDKCILYLNLLELFELITKEKDENSFEVISLNNRGEKINTLLNT